MSETQQTTVERITELLYWFTPYHGANADPLTDTVKTIAAEIDALTAERDAARGDYDRVYRDAQKLAGEARDLTERNTLMLESAERGQATVAELRAEVERLTAERDAARDQIAALEASNTEQAQMLAEVERLRPAAEAWEALEQLRRYPMPPKNAEGQQVDAWSVGANEAQKQFDSAAARAREAAKVKP